jgi:hypothetical protein
MKRKPLESKEDAAIYFDKLEKKLKGERSGNQEKAK